MSLAYLIEKRIIQSLAGDPFVDVHFCTNNGRRLLKDKLQNVLVQLPD